MTHQPSKSNEIEEHEMTAFERELAQAILGALVYRGFHDCGKYLDTSLIEHLRPILDAEREAAVEKERERIKDVVASVLAHYHPAKVRISDEKKIGAYEAIEMLSDKLSLTPPDVTSNDTNHDN